MTLDPTVAYLLFQQEHEIRLARAERDRLASQAATLNGHHSMATAVGRRLGAALVALGERLQGDARPDLGELPLTIAPEAHPQG